MITVSTPEKPFTYTAKNTPRRHAIIREYEPEIDALYAAVDESTQADIEPPHSWNFASAAASDHHGSPAGLESVTRTRTRQNPVPYTRVRASAGVAAGLKSRGQILRVHAKSHRAHDSQSGTTKNMLLH